MLWAFLITAVALIAAMLRTRDNILAAISLTFLGVVVAGAIWALYPTLSVAFILVALVYVVAALTLVIVAVASITERGASAELRPAALAALAALPMALLPGAQPQTPNAVLDVWIIPISAALLLYAFIIAARLTHD
ncbi:hypothetical protein [Pyrobaculum neutrophilum]|uniref:Uncharacterized protein n=1 Tax=Pyrobaculum neutrophilum (strain DSM 2338 / JCM 9278 / NBRC 100436 / V24Sta) TaxID=444157 RepID=B1YB20_PYRNV|nr:hypothetical protein [Pyrobaculum neutrophilum]ACB40720.1 conserved hypothetical protein [Pyrobaculum neutrophilum V24Sta]